MGASVKSMAGNSFLTAQQLVWNGRGGGAMASSIPPFTDRMMTRGFVHSVGWSGGDRPHELLFHGTVLCSHPRDRHRQSKALLSWSLTNILPSHSTLMRDDVNHKKVIWNQGVLLTTQLQDSRQVPMSSFLWHIRDTIIFQTKYRIWTHTWLLILGCEGVWGIQNYFSPKVSSQHWGKP